jgi:lipopolysaccharide/colanic/teichoic acid biosynthesis glycosyltransferase
MIKRDLVNIETLKKDILPASLFLNSLRIEKQRADRSKAPLSMAIFSFRKKGMNGGGPLLELLKSLHENTRETDIKGWVDRDVIGLLLPDTDEKGLQHCIKKIANGNGNLPFSVIKATYPDHLFKKILTEEDHSPDLSSNPKFYPRPLLRKMIREEKIRACRTGRTFSLVLFNPHKFISENGTGRGKFVETIARIMSQETKETNIIGEWGEWDRKTLGILLLDTPPESAFELINKLTSKIRAEGYKIIESPRKEIFKVFAFRSAKRDKAPDNGNRRGEGSLSLNRKVRDLSTFRNLEARHELLKCILDVSVSSTLLALLSPVFLLCAILIKIDSPGPVFYRQRRIGKGGKPFTFLKFRTMHENSDEKIHQEHVKQLMNGEAGLSNTGRPGEKSYKLTEDGRVSKLGKFLRKTSIDELPQLINVLKGEMTLVGPRPHPIYEVELYDLWQSYRLNLRPGITGMGQVYGRFNTDYEDVYRLDLQYFKNASFILDLKILFKTFSIVFSGRGAY